MTTRSRIRLVALGGAAAIALLLAASPALATITPPGSCEGTGVFTPKGEGANPRSAASTETITIPKKAEVRWTGKVNLPSPPPPEGRATNGEVNLKLPMGQDVQIGSWNTSGILTENSGDYDYDIPSVLAGFDMTFSGFHNEEGVLFCSGSVTIQVEGSNPLGIPAVALSVLAILNTSLTIRQRKPGRETVVSTASVDVIDK